MCTFCALWLGNFRASSEHFAKIERFQLLVVPSRDDSFRGRQEETYAPNGMFGIGRAERIAATFTAQLALQSPYFPTLPVVLLSWKHKRFINSRILYIKTKMHELREYHSFCGCSPSPLDCT